MTICDGHLMTIVLGKNMYEFQLAQGAIACEKNNPQCPTWTTEESDFNQLNMRNPGLEPGSLCRH